MQRVDTKNVLGNHRNTLKMPVELVNGQCNVLDHYVPMTSNANAKHFVSSTNTTMSSLRLEIGHNLRYDWKWLVYCDLVCPLFQRQCMQSGNDWCSIPTISPANLFQTSANTKIQNRNVTNSAFFSETSNDLTFPFFENTTEQTSYPSCALSNVFIQRPLIASQILMAPSRLPDA